MINEETIIQLKRRGYSVTKTATENGVEIEKNTWWGKFGYDTDGGLNTSHFHWGRTILLTLFTGFVGIIGGVYWLIRKDQMTKEVLSLTQGSK